jgi:radical SAM protein (TIGR01212 family)
MLPYYSYSKYLVDYYGAKVYKLPVNLQVTCPNRDGLLGNKGCIFCSDVGAGFENLSNELSVNEQIDRNMDYIGKKYKAQKYIVYFQNFTNTYIPLDTFKEYIEDIFKANNNGSIVEIAVSTRPDCINDEYMQFLSDIKRERNINITIELGLQTVNYKTLNKIKRGHTLAEFIDAVLRIKRYGFLICAHIILNLPWDDDEDAVECSKFISSLDVDFVKFHALYICDGTEMAELYKEDKIKMISKDEYVDRVILFLQYLKPNTAIQRLIGRAPKENSLFCNWNMSWWKIKDEIDDKMINNKIVQGEKCNYLNGSALIKKGFV